jgi:glutamine amidotransferase
MRIAIIKYNAGNIRSVSFALSRLGYESTVTDDFHLIRSADKVIFPGVGEASTTMNYLKEKGIDNLLRELTQPVLGICLGLQLMCRHSEEGDTPCLGIFDVPVLKFGPGGKIPHMGWNSLDHMKGALFHSLQNEPFVYFVHSYYAELSEHTIASCRYNNTFSAALQKDNYFATQFHPEKSGDPGHRILENFIHRT